MKFNAELRTKGTLDKELKEFRKRMRDYRIFVGVPQDAAPYPDGTSTALVALVQEFGSETQNIPERSFLRSAIEENQEKYVEMSRKGMKRVIEGTLTLEALANLIGLEASGDVQEKIRTITQPPLAARTIAAKGSSKPLVNTGHLAQSIRHEVVEQGES